MKKFIVILIFTSLLLISTAAALKIQCYDDGSITVKDAKKGGGPVTAKLYGSKEKSDIFEVPGKWQSTGEGKARIYKFYSDEALFLQKSKKKYSLMFRRKSYKITCPPFKFSCKIFNISMDSCYKRNNTFTGKFYVYNFLIEDQSMRFSKPYLLRYDVRTKDFITLTRAAEMYTKEFKNISISVKKLRHKNKFYLRWQTDLEIHDFWVKYEGCKKGSVGDRVDCSDMPGKWNVYW